MYELQKKYFETAYRTGSDIWTHKNYRKKVFEFISKIPKPGFVLDVGSGRGVWPFVFVDMGFKVIGIDYVEKLVKTNNEEVKYRGLSDKMRFIVGDVFNTNFQDNSFNLITDFGLVQHLNNQDFKKYSKEISRVLKTGGHVLNVSFSKNTKQFLNFSPANSESGEFQAEGVHYYFFKDEEIKEIYGDDFEIVKQDHIVIEGTENEIFVITLLKKIK